MTANDEEVFERFAERARDFCRLVESTRQMERSALLSRLAVSLTLLYSVAVCLPFVEPATTDVPEASLGIEDWSAVWKILREKFGSQDSYWEVFDPSEKEEPVQAGLSQDISEIYQDLKEGLALAQQGASLADVRWTWRFDFRQHWGAHAVGALRAIHRLICEEP